MVSKLAPVVFTMGAFIFKMKTISIIIHHHGLQIVKELLSSVMLIWELLLKFSIGYDDNDEKRIKDFFATVVWFARCMHMM